MAGDAPHSPREPEGALPDLYPHEPDGHVEGQRLLVADNPEADVRLSQCLDGVHMSHQQD